MDEDLIRLRREYETDRGEVAARRLQAALLRAERRDDVRELFRWKFQCPKNWADLAPTPAAGVRFCDECHREVHFVPDPRLMRDHVQRGHCVAVPGPVLPAVLDGLVEDPTLHGGFDPGRPCVASGGESIAAEIPREVLALLSRSAAQRYRVVPIGVSDARAILAVARPLEARDRDELRLLIGLELDPVIVSEAEIAAALARHYQEVVYELGLPAAGIDEPVLSDRADERPISLGEANAALARDVNDASAWERVGLAHLALGSLARAASALDGALRLDPELTSALIARGAVRFLGQGLEAAIADLTRAVALEPASATAFAARGRVRAHQGDLPGARSDLEAASRLDPACAEHALWIAGLLGEHERLGAHARGGSLAAQVVRHYQGRSTEGELLAEAARARTVERPRRLCKAHGFLGLKAERDGDRVGARAHYEACVASGNALLPEHQWARVRLGASD